MSKRGLALGAGLMVLSCAAAGYRLVQSSRALEASAQGQTEFWYHCPRCDLEMTCPPEFEHRVAFCPRCGSAKSVMEVNNHPGAPGGFLTSRRNKLVLAIVIGVPALLAVTFLLATLGSTRAKAAAPESADASNVNRCPSCSQQLYYDAFMVGRPAACPACQAPLARPPHDRDKVRAWQRSLVKWAKRSARRN